MNNQTLRSFLNGQNVFGEISRVKSYPFIDGQEQVLNNLLLIYHGQSLVFSGFEGIELESLAEMISLHFGEKWERLFTSQLKGADLSAESLRLVEEESTGDETREDSNTSTQKTSAFNSTEMVDDSGSEGESLGTLNTSNLKDVKESHLTYKALFDNLNHADKLDIMRNVVSDVSKFLTIDVY